MDDTTRIQESQPFPIADLRDVPLRELAADHDGTTGLLVNRVLESMEHPQRVPVAMFNSAI